MLRSKRDSALTLFPKKRQRESGSDSESEVSTDIETVHKFVASIEYLNKIETVLDEELAKPSTPFKQVKRIHFDELTPGLVERQVIEKGIPLVVTGVTKNWNKELFSLPWLKENFGDYHMENSPRDIQALQDLTGWTMADYINYIQLDPSTRARHLYGKDITCPEQWRNYLASHLNSYFCYEHRDLVSHLNKEQQPETLMVYIGTENTYTPGHTDICGSLGHNLMVHSDPDSYALWFVAESKDKAKAVKLWGKHGAALDHDNCFLPVEKLAEADFDFYVIKQRQGELVFVPPEGAHQVINKGGCSIKIAWNRVTTSTAVRSYYDVLPAYHRICKAEVYRIKALVYCGIQERISSVKRGKMDERLAYEFPSLIKLLDEIICEEWVSTKTIEECQQKLIKQRFSDRVPHLRTCNFCNLDIFNRCYRCPICTTDHDICLTCVAEGRGCIHNESLVLMEHIPITELKGTFEEAKNCYNTVMTSMGKKPEVFTSPQFNSKRSSASLAFQMVARYQQTEEYQCHQCQRRRKMCYFVGCSESGCDKNYCAMCLWNRYGIKQYNVQRSEIWKCPSCENNCNCADCFKQRDATEEDTLALYRTLLAIDVVLPPSFLQNADTIAGVCDAPPKPGKSQGLTSKVLQQLKSEYKRALEGFSDSDRALKRYKYETSTSESSIEEEESEFGDDDDDDSESWGEESAKKGKKQTPTKIIDYPKKPMPLKISVPKPKIENQVKEEEDRDNLTTTINMGKEDEDVDVSIENNLVETPEQPFLPAPRHGQGKGLELNLQHPKSRRARAKQIEERRAIFDKRSRAVAKAKAKKINTKEEGDKDSPAKEPFVSEEGEEYQEPSDIKRRTRSSSMQELRPTTKPNQPNRTSSTQETTKPSRSQEEITTLKRKRISLPVNGQKEELVDDEIPLRRSERNNRGCSSATLEVPESKPRQKVAKLEDDEEKVPRRSSSRLKQSQSEDVEMKDSVYEPPLTRAGAKRKSRTEEDGTNAKKNAFFEKIEKASITTRSAAKKQEIEQEEINDFPVKREKLVRGATHHFETERPKRALRGHVKEELETEEKKPLRRSSRGKKQEIEEGEAQEVNSELQKSSDSQQTSEPQRTSKRIRRQSTKAEEDEEFTPIPSKIRPKTKEISHIHQDEPTTDSLTNQKKRKATKRQTDDEDEFIPETTSKTTPSKIEAPEPTAPSDEPLAEIEPSPPTSKRRRHAPKNDFLPLDYEASVLVFAHFGITYEEYRRVYNSRSKRERKANGVYWCPCGLLKKTSQSFASHTKACPVYRACLPEHFRTQDDPIFQPQEKPSFLKPLCPHSDTCNDDC